ncbi:MAG: glycerophosphodiester phosphodiesterase family protein [Chloroflexi bacterium]|nr:glycerophosphodiester phosphodiesterase family protein [Chloroflexota bacterium]
MRSLTIREAFNAGETLVFGHRGAMAQAPMNTLAAFELARAEGAAGIELDLRLSRDGHLVVIHDDAVDATTDGVGAVAELTLAEIKRLDAGSWFSDSFAGEAVPTLDEVFDAFGGTLLINIEIKSSRDSVDRMERQLAQCIGRHNLRERIIVSCFDPVVLRRVRCLMPTVMMGFLYQPDMPAAHYLPIKKLCHEARHPRHDMVDEAYMNWARAQGYIVNAWTVNDPQRAIALRDLGVNAIITDEPGLIISALKQC